MLTASEDGTAKLWNLEPGGPGPDRPALVLSAPNASAITAARICPTDPRRIVTAHWGGGPIAQVVLWQWEPGKPSQSRSLGELQGRPRAMTFTPDGQWVGVAGQDRALHVWVLEGGQLPRGPGSSPSISTPSKSRPWPPFPARR